MRTKYIAVLFSIAVLRVFSQTADLGVGAIGLVVSDIERSEQFYTEILGFIPSGGFELSEAWSKEAGMSNNRPFAVKLFKLRDEETATTLKLAYFDRVYQPALKSGIDQYAGVNYLTFYYKDLEGLVSRIKEAGIRIVGRVEGESYELVIVRDPDGVFIELVEER